MAVFSRALLRRGPVGIAVITLGLAWLAAVGAFVYAAILVTPNTPALIAGAAGFLIAGAGILYAVRDPGR